MAVIHKTTMQPNKLELLTPWLPTRPWYRGGEGVVPVLERAGGFRLDDPEGEVGIDFMVVTDASGEEIRSYLVPLTYRGAPLAGAEDALIGTSEHGVLGTRWVYDGAHDPALLGELTALLEGRAVPQAQSLSDTPDPTVVASFDGSGSWDPGVAPVVEEGADGTDVRLGTGAPVLRFVRFLDPKAAGARGEVTAGWRLPDGEERRGAYVLVLDAA
ncbi:maltokinase N-terminal cap-like domain-containing protein [Streptomyces showdoensis]|uniref:1,4-alpha-glucan branching protein n=1 Tax=Streptomyces showdoensis TaxID=68268 RepID=A0A2P2GWN7_STREW|nr:1,4-alpha-glucan-branching protein [Streptomyces showdoensis]KKZ75319.1 1,4-alpha-glucan branching protein [Streptomyces showdoensis]